MNLTDRIVRTMNEFAIGRNSRFRCARFANAIVMHISYLIAMVVQRYDEKKKINVTLPLFIGK